MKRNLTSRTVTVLVLTAIVGCGSSGGIQQAETTSGSAQASASSSATGGRWSGTDEELLRLFAEAYWRYLRAHGQKGPKNLDALVAFEKENGKDTAAIETIQERGYRVAWGVVLRDVEQGTSHFILAYPPEATKKGGLVLMLDGTRKKLPAAEIARLLGTPGRAASGAGLPTIPDGAKLVRLDDGKHSLRVYHDAKNDAICAILTDQTGQRALPVTGGVVIMRAQGGPPIRLVPTTETGSGGGAGTRFMTFSPSAVRAFRKGGHLSFELQWEGKKLRGSARF